MNADEKKGMKGRSKLGETVVQQQQQGNKSNKRASKETNKHAMKETRERKGKENGKKRKGKWKGKGREGKGEGALPMPRQATPRQQRHARPCLAGVSPF